MAQLIHLSKNSYIREHPFTDPISQPTPAGLVAPAQTHSYIFPGDELVSWHTLEFPADHPTAGGITDLDLKSIRLSIIAKHPDIYTEEYGPQYQSTRIFILDQFQTTFNNLNAPLTYWTGDGWAPNLQLNQDRNFRLPSGDFRRQVKFFTTHTPSSNQWQFYFYFPVIFGYEYWKPKTLVDNFFFDPLSPQNGQNEWWYHYFQVLPAGWEIYTRMDLECVVAGVQTVFRSERLLTPDAAVGGDVNDYASNPDYINKSVQTSVVHGVLSTTCFIKNNEPTEVWGFFEKVAAWDVNEQTKLVAVVSVEPYEGGGRDTLTRGASDCLVGSESVFMPLDTSITDDSGLGITTDTGDYIVQNIFGNGAILYFDALDNQKIKVFAMIDDQKFAAAYPGVSQATIYVRLYNNYIDSDKTRMGEKIKSNAVLITAPVTNLLCGLQEPDCAFAMKVYGETVYTEDLNNDKTEFYEWGDPYVTAIDFVLQKRDDTCSSNWVDKATIADQSYGQFFSLGQSPDFLGGTFTDDWNKQYTGVLLSWRAVLLAFGAGNYRMKIVKTNGAGTDTTYYFTTFCLREWNCVFAEGSVVFEYTNKGTRGKVSDPTAKIDYSKGWYGRVRYDAVVKFKESTYKEETNQYGDSLNNEIRSIISEQTPEFEIAIKPIPGDHDWFISTNIIQADKILVTDCNSNNRHRITRLPVRNAGSFTPRDSNLGSPLADVTLSFRYGQNSLRKRNSF